jgi:hypothetical protein
MLVYRRSRTVSMLLACTVCTLSGCCHPITAHQKRLHVVVYIYTIPFDGRDTVTIGVQKAWSNSSRCKCGNEDTPAASADGWPCVCMHMHEGECYCRWYCTFCGLTAQCKWFAPSERERVNHHGTRQLEFPVGVMSRCRREIGPIDKLRKPLEVYFSGKTLT